jgi:hypothetical protein
MRKWCKVGCSCGNDPMPLQQRDSEWIGDVLPCYEAARHDWKRNHTPMTCVQIKFSCSSLLIHPYKDGKLGVDYSLGLASDGRFPRYDADVAGSLSRIPFLFTNSYSYLPLCHSSINA